MPLADTSYTLAQLSPVGFSFQSKYRRRHILRSKHDGPHSCTLGHHSQRTNDSKVQYRRDLSKTLCLPVNRYCTSSSSCTTIPVTTHELYPFLQTVLSTTLENLKPVCIQEIDTAFSFHRRLPIAPFSSLLVQHVQRQEALRLIHLCQGVVVHVVPHSVVRQHPVLGNERIPAPSLNASHPPIQVSFGKRIGENRRGGRESL